MTLKEAQKSIKIHGSPFGDVFEQVEEYNREVLKAWFVLTTDVPITPLSAEIYARVVVGSWSGRGLARRASPAASRRVDVDKVVLTSLILANSAAASRSAS